MHGDFALFATFTMALVTAFAGGVIARRLGLPSMVGYLFAGLVIFQWSISSDDRPFTWLTSTWWQVWLFAQQFDRLWPSNGLPDALNQRMVAREQMKWARMELTRCETLAADGRISDELTRAQAEMQRVQAMYDDAMRILHGMGYRATFQ